MLYRVYFTIASHPTITYNRQSGYTANALLFVGTAPPMKGTLAQEAQAIVMGTTIHRTIADFMKRHKIAAISRGNKQ